jgi:DNA (cytosine-5)-methyltransferase 1
MTLVMGSLCTGYGGLDMGVLAALGGGRIAWVADPDPHVTVVLETRLPGVPNLGDIRRVDWSSVEPVDVITAGFPCQDISSAGKRAGIQQGNRSGLWHDVTRAVRRLRPTLVVVENVAALRWKNGGLGVVLGDLAAAGYDCAWTSLRAGDVGAAHRRERVFLLAWPQGARFTATLSDTAPEAGHTRALAGETAAAPPAGGSSPHTRTSAAWGDYEPAIRRWEAILGRPAPNPVEPGRAGRPRLSPRFVEWLMGVEQGHLTGLNLPRTAQLRLLGNGVVPQQAAHAVSLLLADLAAVTTADKQSEYGQEAPAP